MGSFLGDVTKTLGAVVKAEQGDLTDLGNIVQGKPTVAEQQQNLFDQLTKQGQSNEQLQMSPEMLIAKQQRDLPGFIKAANAQRGLGNFELSVRSNKSLTDDDKATLISAKNSGVPVEDLYKLETQLMGKAETRQETLRKEKAALESQIAKEERAKVAAAEKKKAEVGAIDTFVNDLIAQNPALKSDPEALAIALATYPDLAKVKPEVRANIVEGLQKRGIISVPPSLLDRLIVNVEGLFSRKPAAPATSGFSIRKLE